MCSGWNTWNTKWLLCKKTKQKNFDEFLLAILERGWNILDRTPRERSVWNHYTIERFSVEPAIRGSEWNLHRWFPLKVFLHKKGSTRPPGSVLPWGQRTLAEEPCMILFSRVYYWECIELPASKLPLCAVTWHNKSIASVQTLISTFWFCLFQWGIKRHLWLHGAAEQKVHGSSQVKYLKWTQRNACSFPVICTNGVSSL